MSRDFIVQAQVIKREPPYVRAGVVTTIVGKDGSLIYTGSGVPSNELGVFTDLYIDNVAPNNFYQKDVTDVWVLKGSLQGGKGDDGREVLIQNNGTHIQWQYEGDVSWTNIVEVSTLKGDTGSNIELQKGTTHIQWRIVGDVDWINLIALSELKGDAGRGIVSFTLISTVDKTKTYRLLYTDATYVDINIIDGNDGNDGTGAYQIYVVGGGTLSEAEFNVAITLIPSHIADETIHHTIEELNLLYSDINHNHNLNDLTEKNYNSLTDKPDLSSLHTHANKEDLDNYDPDNFEPANSNIQEHISNTNIHIDSSSELGVDINESTHSLLLWNGLKALKVTFARLKTWIGSYFFAIGGNTFGAKKLIGSTDNQDFGIITNNTERVTVLKNGKVGIETTNPTGKLTINGNFADGDSYLSLLDSGATKLSFRKYYTSYPEIYSTQNLYFTLAYNSKQVIYKNSQGLTFQLEGGNGQINTFRSYNGNLDLRTTGSYYLSLSTNDVERLRISENGHVGIDTITPKSKLQVAGGIQCGDDTSAASVDKVGTIRQRDVDNKTKLEFVRNNNGTYEWEQINDKLSLDQSTPQTIQGLLQNKSTATLESASLGDELLTSSGWDSTGWTGDFVNGFTHTTGNVTPLTNTLAALNATLYQITYTITNRTAGSVNITFGGVSSGAVTSSGAIGNRTASTGTLSITPTTDFNGTIVISIKRITGTYNATYQILDSAGISTLEIRSSLNTLNNTFIGKGAGRYNTTGSNNSAQGVFALRNNTTGSNNSAQGFAALYSNTTGSNNSAQGRDALYSNTTGSNNSAQGRDALNSNTTGSLNSAQGVAALNSNTTGSYNSAQGSYVLQNNTTGYQNSAQGVAALYSNTTGSNNSAQGYFAGRYLADGVTANQNSNNSVFLGSNTKSKQANQTNEIVIGNDAIGNGSNTVTLGHTTVTDTYLRGLVHLNNGIQISDNTSAASELLKGVLRYRENAGGSFCEMVMKKQDGTYAWTTIVSYQ